MSVCAHRTPKSDDSCAKHTHPTQISIPNCHLPVLLILQMPHEPRTTHTHTHKNAHHSTSLFCAIGIMSHTTHGLNPRHGTRGRHTLLLLLVMSMAGRKNEKKNKISAFADGHKPLHASYPRKRSLSRPALSQITCEENVAPVTARLRVLHMHRTDALQAGLRRQHVSAHHIKGSAGLAPRCAGLAGYRQTKQKWRDSADEPLGIA